MNRSRPNPAPNPNEEGFLLVGCIVAIFLILLALSVAAPRVSQALRRDRELETQHRANQYVRAIQLYYRKFGHYPGSIDQLKNSNNQKFLRQEYADPFTGKPDWKLIHVGEAKTTVKGFFGQPLAGLPGASLGSAGGMASNGFGAGGATTSSFGSPSSNSAFGATGATGATGDPGASGSTGGISSQSATSFTGGGAPIMGIGIPKSGESILVVNEQTTYDTWEFIYDPRIEQMKAKASLFGGAPSTGLSGLGSASGMNSGFPGATGTTGATGATGTQGSTGTTGP